MRSDSPRAGGASAVVPASNRLIDALPADHRQRLTGFLRRVFVDAGTVLIREGTAVESVDFPRSCVVSLASPVQGGSFAEVALVGNEGIVGVPLVRDGSLAMRGICSVSRR